MTQTVRNFSFAVTILVCVFVFSCGARAESVPSQSARQDLSANLSDRSTWAAKTQRIISQDDLVEALAKARVVILGEVHDNPEHHVRRAQLIASLVSRRNQLKGPAQKPAVVFEHFKVGEQADLAKSAAQASQAGNDSDVDTFLKSMSWEQSGWPEAEVMAPLFRTVLSEGLPLYAGDPDTDQIRAVAKQGFEAVSPVERKRLRLTEPLGQDQDAASLQEIHDAHCGLVPKKALAPMAAAQRLRDATLADATLAAAQKHGAAILLTGNNHARKDRGVPWHLQQRGLTNVVSVQFLQAESKQETNPATRVSRSPDGTPVADFVVMTPHRPSPDHCQKLRQHFRKKGG